jgi:hypothetical protein
MRALRVLTAMAVLGVAVAGGSISAQQKGIKPLTGQDYLDIQQLISKYNQGSDLRDAEMWLSIWTPDATFQIGTGKPMVGTKDLTDFRMNSFKSRKPESKPRHWDSSLVLTPTAEGANGRMYYVTYESGGKVPVLTNSGYYDDVFVRTPAGWRLKNRVVNFDAPPAATSTTR